MKCLILDQKCQKWVKKGQKFEFGQWDTKRVKSYSVQSQEVLKMKEDDLSSQVKKVIHFWDLISLFALLSRFGHEIENQDFFWEPEKNWIFRNSMSEKLDFFTISTIEKCTTEHTHPFLTLHACIVNPFVVRFHYSNSDTVVLFHLGMAFQMCFSSTAAHFETFPVLKSVGQLKTIYSSFTKGWRRGTYIGELRVNIRKISSQRTDAEQICIPSPAITTDFYHKTAILLRSVGRTSASRVAQNSKTRLELNFFWYSKKLELEISVRAWTRTWFQTNFDFELHKFWNFWAIFK